MNTTNPLNSKLIFCIENKDLNKKHKYTSDKKEKKIKIQKNENKTRTVS